MSRRDRLGYLSLGLALLAGALVSWYIFFVPNTLRIGVAPPNSEQAQFLSALSAALKREDASVRLAVQTFASGAEIGPALVSRKIDMAVMRADQPLPTSALGVAILQHHTVIILARPDAGITKMADLAGKTVAILGRGEANDRLFDIVIAPYGELRDSVKLVRVTSPDALNAGVHQHFDALFLAAPRGGRGLGLAFQKMEQLVGSPPVVVPLGEVAPLLGRNPAFAKTEFVAGEFSNAPPNPPSAVTTVMFPALIVAHRQLAASAVQEFTKQLFALRQALTAQSPAAGRVAALSTDRGAAVAVHPGAAVYYDATETSFLERYSDLTWLVLFGFSSVASLVAWVISMALPRRREQILSERAEAVRLIEQARGAGSMAEIEEIERRVDKLVVAVSDHVYNGVINSEQQQPAFDLLFARIASIIEERREELARQ
jgi:TRAP-type uncharacterized transport system substrate-binding protein